MFCRSKLLVILVLALISLAGCGAESSTVSPVATPAPPASGSPTPGQPPEPAASSPVPSSGNETPQPSSVLPLHDVVTDPDKYVGQQVTVEGVLEAEGQMPRLRFFLVDGTDRLEISPWAPVEAVQSPQGGGKVKTMAYYAGLRLRLTGILEKGDAGPLLKVSVAEELQ
jgi:hypothetical protein